MAWIFIVGAVIALLFVIVGGAMSSSSSPLDRLTPPTPRAKTPSQEQALAGLMAARRYLAERGHPDAALICQPVAEAIVRIEER